MVAGRRLWLPHILSVAYACVVLAMLAQSAICTRPQCPHGRAGVTSGRDPVAPTPRVTCVTVKMLATVEDELTVLPQTAATLDVCLARVAVFPSAGADDPRDCMILEWVPPAAAAPHLSQRSQALNRGAVAPRRHWPRPCSSCRFPKHTSRMRHWLPMLTVCRC